MSKTVIPALLLTLSVSAYAAEKHMLILGGGGEPQNIETTIFDPELKSLGKFVNKNKMWSPRISFNGGHNVTEKIINQGIGKSAGQNTHFTARAYEQLISEYESKILRGEIKSGDQLLLYISTHGAQKQDKDRTHQISTTGASSSDLTTLDNSSLVSVDRLQRLVTLAEERGVKLGLLDFSCHSGATLALKNPNTCIISASGPDHFSFSIWGTRFANNMSKGKNLEDIFLATFNNRPETSFPMISSPVGMDIQEEIYSLISPYLFYWKEERGRDKLSKYLEEQVISNQCEEAQARFGELLELLQNTSSILGGKNISNGLMTTLTEYQTLQKKMLDDLNKMGLKEMSLKKERFCSEAVSSISYTRQTGCSEWTQKEIMMMDYDKVIRQYQKMKETNPAVWYDIAINNLHKARARKEALLSENPTLKDHENYYKNIPKLSDKTWNMAFKVSKELQKFYTEQYKARTKFDRRPNPCRDFVL